MESLELRRLLSTTWYVDAATAGPTHDGTSWGSAYTDLQQALASSAAGDAIHVAQGTYKPTSTTDRTISFQLKNGIEIDGGYAGSTSATPDARDVAAYATILSGDIGTVGSNTDNSYHVVFANGTDSTAVLDGFMITGGMAEGHLGSQGVGAGISNYSANPTIRSCIFASNRGISAGAVYNSSSSPTFVACEFLRNIGDNSGGAILNYESSPNLDQCIFVGNSAVYLFGGAISNSTNSSPISCDCVMIGNFSKNGGAIQNDASDAPLLINCTIIANEASVAGGGIDNASTASVNLINCVLRGNTAPSNEQSTGGLDTITYSDIQGGYAGTGNIDADPMFYRNPSPGADGTWGTADDDYGDLRLLPNSPCIDAGSNSAVPAGVTTDIAGNPRIVDFPGVKAAGAIVDMGAYEVNTDLGAMHLAAGQNVVLPAGHHVFSVTSLTIDPGASLDFKDDSLVLDYSGSSPLGSWDGGSGAYTGINGMIESGAIFSSLAQSKYTTIAAGEASDVLSLSGSATAIWGGQTVDSTSVLIKFTYAGDANLDGKVNIDDYGRIDGNVGSNGSVFGWFNGDFNFDGKVNIDDYGLIDSVIGTQGAVL